MPQFQEVDSPFLNYDSDTTSSEIQARGISNYSAGASGVYLPSMLEAIMSSRINSWRRQPFPHVTILPSVKNYMYNIVVEDKVVRYGPLVLRNALATHVPLRDSTLKDELMLDTADVAIQNLLDFSEAVAADDEVHFWP